MEEIVSSSDGDVDSDEFSKEREEELYSVLHYNDFSQGIPPELLEKYSISRDDNNEFVISFRNQDERSKSNGSKPTTLNERPGSSLNDHDSSDDDVVVVESDSTSKSKNNNFLNKTGKDSNTKSAPNPKKRDSIDAGIASLDPKSPKHARLDSKLAPNPKMKSSDKSPIGSDPKGKNNPVYRVSESGGSKSGLPKRLETCSELASSSSSQGNKDVAKSGMISNPKDKTNAAKTNTPRVDCEVVVEEYSDSDGSSVVVIEDPEANRKISVSSTESVVALLSSDEDSFEFSLNTSGEMSYDSDGNVSDVIEKSQFEWEKVASPSSWTREMKKYYNSSCERLRYFDHKKIRAQIKTGSSKDWMISTRDRYPNSRPRQRCLICRQSDHLARNCPKQDPTCHMCGVPGHSHVDCPNSICLQCGKQNRQFTAICRSCTHTTNRACFNCQQTGHESKACPEKWREFHSTTEGPLKKTKSPANNRPTQCCNCGKTNHTFEECNQQYMSSCLKSLPAYDWLFGRRSSREDWRYSSYSGFSPRNSFVPRKRQRGHDRDSFFDDVPQWRPVHMPRKKKKKGKSPRKPSMSII